MDIAAGPAIIRVSRAGETRFTRGPGVAGDELLDDAGGHHARPRRSPVSDNNATVIASACNRFRAPLLSRPVIARSATLQSNLIMSTLSPTGISLRYSALGLQHTFLMAEPPVSVTVSFPRA
jgi:hypothetical protein